jgi:hypothetical protein
MSFLRESVLLKKVFGYFTLPFMVFGILALFFPYVYAFVPVH